ncbi:ABC transporter permease [Blastococcus sp. URHD0036]|uniref:ABC transporter permease n=1 Tax=Blastococcus sp. URHD0036 TaxID=1380356 RepID=UPI0004969158|nr:ABC transporter permease [Blastococcus sp. URHD0036]
MIGAVGRRLLLAIPILVVVSLLSFLLIDLTPGSPAELLAGEGATPERVAELEQTLGLDQPIWQRFGDYMSGLLQGDFGTSLFSGQSVGDAIGAALPVTVSLIVVAYVLVFVIAIPLGVLAAVRRDTRTDRAISATCSFFLGIPSFVVALVLVILLALTVEAFPATGYKPLADGFGVWLSHLILPGLALALTSAAEVTRQLRGALVDVLEQDYIRTQRAKGLPPLLILGKHGLKNAAPPVLTVIGLQLARMLGSTVIIEQVFAMPGFGALTLNAVLQHDFPLIQGCVLVSAIAVIGTTVVVDVVEAGLNPRLRSAA